MLQEIMYISSTINVCIYICLIGVGIINGDRISVFTGDCGIGQFLDGLPGVGIAEITNITRPGLCIYR